MISESEIKHDKTDASQRIFAFGEFAFDAENKILMRAGSGEIISLPPKTCELLSVFIEYAGQILSKDELLNLVWKNTFVEESNLTHHISLLRKSMGDGQNENRLIQTIQRKGYRFNATVNIMPQETFEITVSELTTTEIISEEESNLQSDKTTKLLQNKRSALRTLIFAFSFFALAAAGAGFFWFISNAKNKNAASPRLIPVTTYAGQELDSSISPDGKFVAFSGFHVSNTIQNPNDPGDLDSFNVYVKQADGESLLQITDKPGRAISPTWSPDGRFIAYAQRFPAEIDRNSVLYIIPAFGGADQKIYEAFELAGIDWSPDGNTIVFTAREGGDSPHKLFSISLETRDVRQLTFSTDGEDLNPKFSPDGKSIAYVRSKNKTAEIFLIPAEGGEPRAVTSDNKNIVGNIAWTTDSKNLIFGSNRTGEYRLWEIPISGSEMRLIGGAGEPAFDVSVSADGKRLAYTRQDIDFNIWRVPLENKKGDPTRAERIVSSSRPDRCPAISPDGKKISFVSSQTGGARQVWIAEANGKNAKQLTNFADGTLATRTIWSPDSTRLVFDVASTGGNSVIYTLNVEGGVPQKLTDETADSIAPSWSQDGNFVYFTKLQNEQWQVWRMPATGGEAVQITKNGGYEAHESPDGRFLYFNKPHYGTIGLFRQPINESGAEEKVFDLLQVDSLGEWFLTEEGIYFLHRVDGGETPARQPRIRFFDLGKREFSDVSPLQFQPFGNPGLSVSPDGKWLYYSINDKTDIDIMMVENFE